MVLEGVHLVPGMLPLAFERAIVGECVLAIEDEQAHAGHFWIRDAASDGVRPLDKYLERLDDIRALQRFLVERAEQCGVPVIQNTTLEQTITAVLELVLTTAEAMQKV